MKATIYITVFFFFSLSIESSGQNVLTRQQAIEMAINNNYGIQLAQNNIRIAENNRTKENNGYYPIVDASAGPGTSFGGSTQRFNNGMQAETRNAFSWNAGASIIANYTLYDESRSIQLDQMKEVLNLTNLQLRQTIEATLIQVYNQYYTIAQLTENLLAVEEALTLSRKRMERAQIIYDYSQGLRLDVLNAQVDISRDSVIYLNVLQQIENAKRDLEVIIGERIEGTFSIDPIVDYDATITKESIFENALQNNVLLLLSDQNQVINEFDLQIIGAVNKPKIGANAGLSYNHQASAPGSFISSSTSSGLNLGVTLNWNIFDGGRKKVLEQNARINLESEALTRDQIVKELRRDIDNAWGNYQNALYILEVEQNSLEINRLNLERTADLFERGQLTSIEFRQAQLNLLNSETGYNTARYDAKLIELQLMYLSGNIMSVD